MRTVKYSIVIPTFNHLDDCLKPCINSIIEHTSLDDVEIIIVANGCTDGTEEWIDTISQSLPRNTIKYVSFDEPIGYTRATNVGIQQARGEYVILFNNDNQLIVQNRNQWLKLLVEPFESDPKCGISGVTKVYDKYSKHKFVIFFCAMVRRQTFKELGLLDEIFTPGSGEDIEFSIKLHKAGYNLYQVGNPDSEVWSYYTQFPIYHAAERTVHGTIPWNWDEVFNRNMQLIKQRYQQPVKYSIIVAAPDRVDKLKTCINSIWKYTDFAECEIVIVANSSNKDVMEYLNQIKNFGPYEIIETHAQVSENVAYSLATPLTGGKYVIFMSGMSALLSQDKNAWLNGLERPMSDEVALTGVYVMDGTISMFCCMALRSLFKGKMINERLPEFVQSLGFKARPSDFIANTFPIYYAPWE